MIGLALGLAIPGVCFVAGVLAGIARDGSPFRREFWSA